MHRDGLMIMKRYAVISILLGVFLQHHMLNTVSSIGIL
jgi:hypothetical protein